MPRTEAAPAPTIEITPPSLICAEPGCDWPGEYRPNPRRDTRYCRRHATGSTACRTCGSVERWQDIGHANHCTRCEPEPALAAQLTAYADAAGGETKQQLRDLAEAVDQNDRDLGLAQLDLDRATAAWRTASETRMAARATAGTSQTTLSRAGVPNLSRQTSLTTRQPTVRREDSARAEAAEEALAQAEYDLSRVRHRVMKLQRVRSELRRQASLTLSSRTFQSSPRSLGARVLGRR